MKHRLLFLLALFSLSAHAQNWSTFLNPSRAIDWSGAGFTIPSYTTNCATQPTLTPDSSSAASANATAIQNALASCDATHNVVNVAAGKYYVAGFHYGAQGQQVLRGAGANQTDLIFTSYDSCAGWGHGACMLASTWTYNSASNVEPSGGSNQCTWSSGYSQGTTTIGLTGCGGTPPLNQTIILDQANDTSDSGGVYMCDGSTSNCTYEGSRNANGRTIGGKLYSLEQVVMITGLTSLGGGAYSATISPGIYSTNIRSSQAPGAWWPGFVKNDGIENMTLDGTSIPGGNVAMISCYQCWAKGIRFIDGDRNDVLMLQGAHDVVRDSYFYAAQSHDSTSYTIELDNTSDDLIENNIFQQITIPTVFNGSVMGTVAGYNFSVHNIFADGTWTWGIFMSHSVADNMNLFEGNDVYQMIGDNASGPSTQDTFFRNLLSGYQPTMPNDAEPVLLRALNRDENVIGNVLGQPNFHTQYQGYPTSTSAFTTITGPMIYDLGGGGTGDACALNVGQSTLCDPLSYTTMMRWGNYDVVNAATRWNPTEASPAANAYVNANFTSSYFSSLTQTLPASLFHSSTPSWWPSGKAWPPIGPDVSTGNVGICTGAYAGWQGTSAGQCSGGTLSAAWASHATSIPAQDCYLNTMGGPPDGSGDALSFNANTCYSGSNGTTGTAPGSPIGLSATVN